jgi:hypothetical protein
VILILAERYSHALDLAWKLGIPKDKVCYVTGPERMDGYARDTTVLVYETAQDRPDYSDMIEAVRARFWNVLHVRS